MPNKIKLSHCIVFHGQFVDSGAVIEVTDNELKEMLQHGEIVRSDASQIPEQETEGIRTKTKRSDLK